MKKRLRLILLISIVLMLAAIGLVWPLFGPRLYSKSQFAAAEAAQVKDVLGIPLSNDAVIESAEYYDSSEPFLRVRLRLNAHDEDELQGALSSKSDNRIDPQKTNYFEPDVANSSDSALVDTLISAGTSHVVGFGRPDKGTGKVFIYVFGYPYGDLHAVRSIFVR